MSDIELKIIDFESDELVVRALKPKGFSVEAIGLSASFKCYEGYNLAPRHAVAVIESDVLDLDFLFVSDGANGCGLGHACWSEP